MTKHKPNPLRKFDTQYGSFVSEDNGEFGGYIYQFVNDKEYKCLYSGGDIFDKFPLLLSVLLDTKTRDFALSWLR